MKLTFNLNDGEIRHTCKSHQEGDWIVFTCPQCEGYERRININTGKMETRALENNDILHIGNFQPAGSELLSGLN
jgi:hypothetical protein